MLLSVLFVLTLVATLFVGVRYLDMHLFQRGEGNAAAGVAASMAMGQERAATPARSGAPQENAFRNLSLIARGAVVYDVTRAQFVFARDARRPLPLASLTKIMTALAALEVLGGNALVPLTPYAIAAEGDSGLTVGEVWRSSDLTSYMLITSSNDAAVALAQAAGARLLRDGGRSTTPTADEATAAFVAHMNRLAAMWGLEDLRFQNPSGLDLPEEKPGAVGSARDVALLFLRLMRTWPELARVTREADVRFAAQTGEEHQARNTNRRIKVLPGLLASKTGYTDLAGGNLAVIADSSMGEPMVIVVLGSSFEERFTDVEQLLQAAFRYRRALR